MGNKKVYDLFKKYNFSYEDIKRSLKEELNEYQYTYFNNGLEKAERIYLDNIKRKIGVVCVFDEEFPKSLVDATKPCLLLYYCGNLSLLKSKCVTVIGTRKPDEPFANNGVEAVKKLVENNYTIVSGLALGCDTIAHTACLDNNGTHRSHRQSEHCRVYAVSAGLMNTPFLWMSNPEMPIHSSTYAWW